MPGTLKVGLAGLGVVSRSIIPSIQKTANVQLTAVADVREHALDEARSRYGVETYTSMESSRLGQGVPLMHQVPCPLLSPR